MDNSNCSIITNNKNDSVLETNHTINDDDDDGNNMQKAESSVQCENKSSPKRMKMKNNVKGNKQQMGFINEMFQSKDTIEDNVELTDVCNESVNIKSNSSKSDTTTLANGNKCLHVKFNSPDKKCRTVKKFSDTKDQQQQQQQQSSPSSVSTSSCTPSADGSSEDNSSFEQFAEARPPDGGWGWVVVAASFMVNLIADGITFSFGVIFVEFLNYFNAGKSKTAWIGSLFIGMPLLSGPIASYLTERYGCRRVSIAGSILATFGFVVSSFASSMGILILTFGIVAGFGLSLCFVAAVVIVAYYFDKRRSFATGLSVCGSGIGTFIFPPLTQYLLDEYGWRGTTLILAGFFLNLAVCGCLMRDLEWTTVRAKAKSAERKRIREKKREKSSRIQSSSADSFSATTWSVNTTTHNAQIEINSNFASINQVMPDGIRRNNDQQQQQQQQQHQTNDKLFSSLLTLPTFLKNNDQIPVEVLDLLSTRKDIYNVLLHNNPMCMMSSRSFSDSATIADSIVTQSIIDAKNNDKTVELKQIPTNIDDNNTIDNTKIHDVNSDNGDKVNIDYSNNDVPVAYLWWLNKLRIDGGPLRRSSIAETQSRPIVPPAYLNNIRKHRHSLTYRGAMLNINRYRLRASSCPDIYRNSITTITKTKFVWYSGVWEFWDLLVDMLDFSHFSDSRFLLFSISNFLLHTWYDVPYVYLTDNAIEMGFSETDASILISIIGIANMLGEIFLGWAGDRAWVNASIVYATCMILCGAITSLIPLAVDNYYALCSVSGAFGIFIAANYSLTSIILVEVITIERFTNAYGLLLLVQGVANLMGPPLAGWLYDITGSYDLSFYLAGFFIALSGFLLMVVPLMGLYNKYIKKNQSERTSEDFAETNSV